ncbi:VpsF family polysaccharide biosynthesis protein [Bosea beijingensis]|uniref:VpsF family polysaccharide biosynthesis protein n=1 Tax=Bosea beijingensis TaxID=3068632 RepID=UPI0027417348|nr:VpsF family polysaccharide biosynthesis protein [Bosea sp. REN20]
MRAASSGASAGLQVAPGWARLDGLSRIMLIAAVLVLFCVSGGMLWLVGYNYDGLTGSAASKIHPSTYLIVLAFCWSVIASGDPVSRSIHLASVRPATLLMLLVTIAVIIVTILRGGAGIGGMVDTYIASCLLVFLLADADDETMATLTALLHVVMTLNALLALAEFVTQIRLFPYRFDGIAFETDTRSAALHGHPLANAMITACYLMALISGARPLSPAVRGTLIALQSAALVVFGGRTALLVSLALGLCYGIAMLFSSLRGGRVPLVGAAIACVLAAFLPVAIGGLAVLGFFDDLATRFVSDGGSANARKEMLDLLGMFSLGDLVFGPDNDLVDTLRRVNGLEWGIENPFIRMVLYQGAIVTALVTVAFGLFMYEFARVGRAGGVWLPMVVWIILLNGSESIATKTNLPAKFAIVVFCLYRPERPARTEPLSPASAARVPRSWPDRAAG